MEELTTAESMVMKTIWDHPHEMALQEIMKLTNETYGKDWKSQTVSTYIAKLVKKGFLRMNQSGRNATYEIIIPELSYQQEQSRKFVKFWNRGSVAQFLTAFYKDHKLTKALMNWINNLFYMGLFTALTGSIAFAVYAVVAGVLDGLKKYRYIYGLLLVVLPFWLFPGLFLLLYVTHYRKMGEALFIKGHLFELTPVIAHIECVAAVVWLLGAATVLVLHLVRYYRVEHYIKKHRMPAEKRLQLVAAGTKERLKIRGNVEVYCCYGISSPMVLGLFHKWIVLPVRDFSPESLQIVLTHEFVHVRQHILTLKCVGRVLEDLFWYNPLIYIFNRRLDFWSEMACDMECCRDSENVFSVGQYFRAALELLTEETRPLEFPFSMFGAQNHLQERIRRMKQYRKQKEMKPLAVLASFILVFLGSICFTCGAGIGTQKAVQKIYAKTVQQKKVNVQMEVMDNQVCYATQIETDPDAGHSYMVKEEPYDVYKQAVMDAFPEDITEDSIKLSAEIPKQTLCKWAVKGKPQKISITVDTIRADKTIRVGILTSAHKRVYIEANGEVGQLFETSDKEFIRSVFIENTDVDTVKISGIATMLSDSEQNAGNTQR